jgi:hypothetical protein
MAQLLGLSRLCRYSNNGSASHVEGAGRAGTISSRRLSTGLHPRPSASRSDQRYKAMGGRLGLTSRDSHRGDDDHERSAVKSKVMRMVVVGGLHCARAGLPAAQPSGYR